MHDTESHWGIIFFGSSSYSAEEAVDRLTEKNIKVNSLRLRALPFQDEVVEFVDNHERVFVIEQNRDGQMRKILINECDFNPHKLISVLNYDGLPITAGHICEQIEQALEAASPPAENELQGGTK